METIHEATLRKGKAEGKAEGRAEGKAAMVKAFLSLARQRFQSVPKRREAQVRSASLEQLQDWLDRLLEAPSLDALFGGSGVGRARRQPQG